MKKLIALCYRVPTEPHFLNLTTMCTQNLVFNYQIIIAWPIPNHLQLLLRADSSPRLCSQSCTSKDYRGMSIYRLRPTCEPEYIIIIRSEATCLPSSLTTYYYSYYSAPTFVGNPSPLLCPITEFSHSGSPPPTNHLG